MFCAIDAQIIVSMWDKKNENGKTMKGLIKITPNIRNFIHLLQLCSSTQGMSFLILIEIKACEKSNTE
jgi:hypothetical protein